MITSNSVFTRTLRCHQKGGIAHFGFNIENFDEIMEKCKTLGIEVLYDGPVQFERSQSIYIKDPNGYEIELSEVSGGGL